MKKQYPNKTIKKEKKITNFPLKKNIKISK